MKISGIKNEITYNGFEFFNSLTYDNEQKYICDILEETKDERFMITNDKVIDFLDTNNIEDVENKSPKIIKLFDLPREVWNDLDRQRRVYSIKGISPTILARSDTTKIYIANKDEHYVRKFTPRECFRLQGFDDSFIDNILKSVSLTQQYKEAGNAVSPPVITGIINHLIEFMEE